MIDAMGRRLTTVHRRAEDREIQEEALCGVTPLAHPTVMIRRTAVTGWLRGVTAGFRFSSNKWMFTGQSEHLFRLDRLLYRYEDRWRKTANRVAGSPRRSLSPDRGGNEGPGRGKSMHNRQRTERSAVGSLQRKLSDHLSVKDERSAVGSHLSMIESVRSTAIADRADRIGVGRFRFVDLELLDAQGRPCDFVITGEDVGFRMRLKASR